MTLIFCWVIFILKIASSELIVNPAIIPVNFENISYNIELVFPNVSATSDQFYGTLIINLDRNVLPESMDLYASLDLLEIKNIQFSGTNLTKDNFELFKNAELIKINLNGLGKKDKNFIKIEYIGTINTVNDNGIYRSHFFDKEGIHYFLTTNLAQNYARQVFPNFGEITTRATFQLLVKIPTGMSAISNAKAGAPTPDTNKDLSRIPFNKTPKIPPSSLSLTIADLYCSQPELLIKSTRYQICHRKDIPYDKNVTYFPKSLVKDMLEYFNEFTQQNYSSYMGKISQVAFLGYDFNSISELGIISSGENNVFWDESESSDKDLQKTASSITSQISKQWFGNLVMPKTSSDRMLLVQGFTEYFQYAALNHMYPSWNLDNIFIIENFQNSLATDSSENQSDISKNRGASLVRMIEHFMQLNTWDTCIQEYLSNSILKTVQVEDLWKILEKFNTEKLPSNLSEIMENWLKNSMYPLINIKSNGEIITATQEPFILNGKPQKWYIPISFTKSNDANKFKSTKPQAWLEPTLSSTKLTNLPESEGWILLNNQETGYYRVNYDTKLWNNIKQALVQSNFDGIVETKRAQIVDDLFNFVIYDKMSFTQVGDILKFLKNDISFYTWYSAFKGYGYFLDRVGYKSDLGKEISEDILKLLNKTYNSININKVNDDKLTYTEELNVEQVLHWACKLGNKNCLETATKLFYDFVSKNVTIHRNLKKFAYCNGLRYTNESQVWDLMWNALTNSSTDFIIKPNIMYGLACVNDSKLLEKYLNLLITENFTPEDVVFVFRTIMDENFENHYTARDFLLQNFDKIIKRIPNTKYIDIIITGIASRFTTNLEIELFKNFKENHKLTDVYQKLFSTAVDISEINIKWLNKHRQDIENFYFYNKDYFGQTTSILALILFAFYASFTYCFYNRDLIFYVFATRKYQQGNEIFLMLT